ncbi:hypothetical protein COV19_04120 [Candidatus Woesearchaeota archaeon CG10_big_fil_rev_8_21_14_0_10_44_13]|nr:MAG: hypothetical protein COV19_04120 [Candidatus Woesearchaeota archaeon CG10_big_fil_rev_8_21_14_0_10_44_13]
MISVIVPAYNEERNLAVNIPIFERYLAANIKEYEIIIVDDGSKDSTRRVAEAFARKNSRINIICHNKNKGRGYAVREGMKRAIYQNIFMMDSDMPSAVNLGIVKNMLHSLKTNDIVIASRFIKGSNIKRKTHRVILSAIYRKLVKAAFPRLKVSDTDSGLKAFRKGIAMAIAENTKENRWSWDLETVVFARKNGFDVKEIPLEWKEKGSSTLNLFIDPIEQLCGVMKSRINYGKI